MKLSERISSLTGVNIRKDLVMEFGDRHDGAIEFAGLLPDGIIEVGYFYGDIKPKNILVLSSQIGCPSKCSFCALGNAPFTRNLTANEIYEQAVVMLQQAARYGIDIDTNKHKVNIAKSGEPLFNNHLVAGLEKIATLDFSFKVSTVFPFGKIEHFKDITHFAADYHEPVQIQVSLISTSEEYRRKAAGIRVASFQEIREAADYWFENHPKGRKINLSLILTGDVPCKAKEVAPLFPPDLFRFRFRNYVPTGHGKDHDLTTMGQWRYDMLKDSFADEGYEVGDWAAPTPIEQRFQLAGNVTRGRYLRMIKGEI